jgi:cytochrome bd ubiquinol oxidase subunit I
VQIGGGKNDETPTQIINIPDLLSILATNHVDGQVLGLNQINAQYQQMYGPGDYVPNVFIQYWSMRVMAYLATLIMLFALWGGWNVFRRRLDRSRWFLRIAPWAVIAPFLMNTAGWLLTENGRQPWIVQGLMKTANGVSPSVSATDIWISIIVFLVVFVALGIAAGWLMLRYGRRELGHDLLASVTSPGGTPGSSSLEAESSDEDESSLVY